MTCALGIVHHFHVVDTVAVDARRLVRLLIGRNGLEQHHRPAVEIVDIGVKDIGAEAIAAHQFGVRVALGAELRRKEVEGAIRRPLHAVNLVAIGTRWHVWISFTNQSRAMHAPLV